MGRSLGKVTYCLIIFVAMGLVKANNFRRNDNKLDYFWLLTKTGIEEKTRVGVTFFRWIEVEYEALNLAMDNVRC